MTHSSTNGNGATGPQRLQNVSENFTPKELLTTVLRVVAHLAWWLHCVGGKKG
jgi:hypothetical protein